MGLKKFRGSWVEPGLPFRPLGPLMSRRAWVGYSGHTGGVTLAKGQPDVPVRARDRVWTQGCQPRLSPRDRCPAPCSVLTHATPGGHRGTERLSESPKVTQLEGGGAWMCIGQPGALVCA